MGNNIYIFTNSYKPLLGGIQTVTSQVAESLHKQGENVIVVSKFANIARSPLSHIEGVPVIRLLFNYNIEILLLLLLFILRTPKTVFVHFPQEQAKYIVWLRKWFKFRIITCFHGHDTLMYEEGYSKKNDLYCWKRQLVHISDKVTACSAYMGNKVESAFSISGVIPVYNGVDLSRYDAITPIPQGYESPYLFAFGRLEKIKGYDMLINAFAELKEHDDLHLYIAGDGSQRNDLQELIDKSNLSDRIKLIGRKSPREIVQLTQHAEVIVIPSYRESFGIVVLEAIAAKRPIVATEAGGIPEIMDSRFGELVAPSVFGIAQGIEKALAGQGYQFDDAKDYLGEFSIENMVDNYMNLAR